MRPRSLDFGIEPEKACCRCGDELPLEDFPRERRNVDGRGGACLGCRRAARKTIELDRYPPAG